ncbi:monooxygenase [Byssothecium circinans]|uniref:Monooxygenase n=1 Tax=Byssothecium circinans TaxID=147558 RepID=A0A6A5TCR6_9PLEO|nr:monooxygenase [Byssothecium circinans]
MEPLHCESIYAERSIKVICIGAGASGLLLAYKLNKHCSNVELTIYEKNEDIAGTWHENQYPGCACDVPAHNYTYSFEPKPDWSSVYASSSEIKEYFTKFCEKYGLQDIRLFHSVQHALWVECDGEWEVEILDIKSGKKLHDRCHILIHACGYLNKPAFPNIPGIQEFKGNVVHSGCWDKSVELTGKTVALLGSGSSALQILPAIQPAVERVVNFVRSPVWVLPTISGESKSFTKDEIQVFRSYPDKHIALRKHNETVMNSIFSLYLTDSKLQIEMKEMLRRSMKFALKDKDMEAALVPEWGVGCRRLAPDTGYLNSVTKPNVRIVKAGVSAFYSEGCVDELGERHHVEVIICATGYDTSFVPRFPVIGLKGVNLQSAWEKTPSSYLGIGIANFPNFMMFLGPYSPVANGPTMVAIEAQADYIVRMIDQYQTEPIHSFCPSTSAESAFMEHVKGFMKHTVYTDECRSGHKNHTISGRVPTLWPGSTLHYLQAMQDIRSEDWQFSYSQNRFSFLGNGISHAEFDPTSDLAYYIREYDDGPPLSRRGRMKLAMYSGCLIPRRDVHVEFDANEGRIFRAGGVSNWVLTARRYVEGLWSWAFGQLKMLLGRRTDM